MALLLMDLHRYGYLIAQLSWLWLFTLGLLGYRSGPVPPGADAQHHLLHGPCVAAVPRTQCCSRIRRGPLFPLEILSEVSLLLYLLIKGVRTPRSTPPAPGI